MANETECLWANGNTEDGKDTQKGRHWCEKGSRSELSREENSEEERLKEKVYTGVRRRNKAVKRMWLH